MTIEDFNRCVDEHSDALFRFILKNVKDRDKAADIVQDSFEKLWYKIENVDATKVKSYLFRIAFNTFIDNTRRDKKFTVVESYDDSSYTHNSQYSDLNEILHTAIERLPEIQKSVVLLRDYEGYTYEDIAEITGLNESQVKVYIYRARMFLKNYIGKIEAVI